jgi:type I restriction enzyme, S subunit
MSESETATASHGWRHVRVGDLMTRISHQVTVDPSQMYQEIGILSHGNGLFYKKPVLGRALGDKRVFWIKPNCLVLNIVFAWEQAIGRTTDSDAGKIASHRFPMYRIDAELADLDYLMHFFKTKEGKKLLELASPGGAGRNKTLGQEEFARLPLRLPPVAQQRRMASLLTTWERAIGISEALLTVKRQRANQLRTSLITGHVGFPPIDMQNGSRGRSVKSGGWCRGRHRPRACR